MTREMVDRSVGEISIRHVRAGDLDAVAEIFNSEHVNLGTQRLPYHADSDIAARIADDPAKVKLVAEIGGEIAGYGELETWPHKPRLCHGGEIDMVATHPGFRGRGVGRALMGSMVDLADRWLQLTRLQLYVWSGNDSAVRLYESFGFEVEGRLRHFVFVDGDYRDALIMARLAGHGRKRPDL
ncbi:GNAT family N-acetyltransferase [uncultured Cohaesibacter sp.]|uniref:GNAT family N-acetyltransferase n=1 Tax=uncultured Cohaesibacter sp. TaxID=1002546 RepID=UPI0029C678E6|nr:GNAT family N-acetyltransferase [uncultured Cohaesibacter sp.]